MCDGGLGERRFWKVDWRSGGFGSLSESETKDGSPVTVLSRTGGQGQERWRARLQERYRVLGTEARPRRPPCPAPPNTSPQAPSGAPPLARAFLYRHRKQKPSSLHTLPFLREKYPVFTSLLACLSPPRRQLCCGAGVGEAPLCDRLPPPRGEQRLGPRRHPTNPLPYVQQ